MFGYPSSYYYPQQYYQPRRAAAPSPSYSSNPFGFGDTGSYYRPTHRPQQHTSYNPYANPLSQYQRDSDEESSDSEEEEYLHRPQRVMPQHQVRLDKPPEQLIPQKRHAQRHPQQARQHPTQQQPQPQPQRPQHPQQQQQHTQQTPTQQQHSQQHAQPHPTQRPAPRPARKVDLNQEAARIQRRWRGWNVRKLDILNKLRALNKIESEVDVLTSTPTNEQIISMSSKPLPSPLPDIDTHYVGKIPRSIVALEHDLTTKLISLDEISGGKSELVRQRRKALASKIEGILSRVDPIKKAYTNSPHHPPPTPTPTPSSSSSSSSSFSSAPMEVEPTPTVSTPSSSDTEPSISEMEIENKKKAPPPPTISDAPLPTPSHAPTPAASSSSQSGEGTARTSGPNFVESMGSMSLNSTPLPPSVSSSSPPSLKQLCYKVCDQLIKKALL